VQKAKRINYLINHNFQLRMILHFVLGVIAAFIIFTGSFIAVGWALNNLGEGRFEEIFTLSTRVETGETMLDPVSGETVPIYDQETTVLWRWEIVTPAILFNNLLILVITSVAGVFYSHRIAGPIYNINRCLQRALQSDLHYEIRLRKQDFFHDTAGLLNEVLQKGNFILAGNEKEKSE